jgi:CBS domain-containing protein
MKVKECMCSNVCYCTSYTKISDVAKMMNSNHVGCVPVCNTDNCVVGILTDRDIILRSIACGKYVCNTDVSEIMTCNATCCDIDEDISNVTRIMSKTGIRRIPVTEKGKLVGILTLGDFAKHHNITNECVGSTLENICNCNNKNAE